ncbi:phosphatidylinositol phosphate synthase [Haloglycomyces albus]|uniref:phosphatidylinositol phosphate synthase n=1 Tax=Haloglycomyces albus TaxID=526067 RepID=UPI00046D7134|nr:CDP-alcohol phosphatidyltransferase family protein [Haloglycomyces albus]
MAKFLRTSGRARLRRSLEAVARPLARIGLTANIVTMLGTAVIVAAAVVLIPQGRILTALIVITLAAFTDLIDGAMARVSGGGSRFGALLDSTCDRIADGALFAALAFYLFAEGRTVAGAFALWTLVASEVISYVKARAESLGVRGSVGLMERPERLILIGVVAIVELLGVPYAWEAGFALLAVLSSVTVVQRLLYSKRFLNSEDRVDAR